MSPRAGTPPPPPPPSLHPREPMDKAGAYAIQGRAALFVTEIRGSQSGIVGLPLYETAQLLQRMGTRRERRNPR